MSDAAAVRAHLAKLPAGTRGKVAQIRSAIRAAAPRATEKLSYQMPSFFLENRGLLWYNGWKHHVSMYPVTAAMVRAAAPRTAVFEQHKGTIRFPLSEPLPLPFIKRLIRARLVQVRQLARPRKPA